MDNLQPNNDSFQTIGHVRILVHEADGSLVSDNLHKNTLTNYAKNASAQMWTGTVLVTPTKIELGNGLPTPPLVTTDPTDTNLWNPAPATLKTCDFATVWLSYYSQYSVTYQTTDSVGTWTEVGLFDANGNLWSHVALNNFIKLNTQTVTVQWQIQHLAS
jgi:hypothetical protein